MKRLFIINFCLLSLFLSSPLHSASNPYKLPDSIDENIRKMMSELFNQDFPAADATFAEIKPQSGKYPMVSLVSVIRTWWIMSVDVLETDEEASRKFSEAADACIKGAERKLAKGDPTGELNLVIGTAMGLVSRWSAANRAWIPAYFRGTKSVEYMEKALKKNPRATDAYMTLGTFNYAKELLSNESNAVGKAIAAGSETEGIKQLEKTYREGIYFQIPAGLLLAGILTNDRPDEALPLLKELRTTLPKSGFVRIIELTALFNAGKIEELENESAEFLMAIETTTYSNAFLPQAYFGGGLAAFAQKKWKQAAIQFGLAIENGTEKNPYYTWAHLYQGYCYDAMRQRNKAKARYQDVLKLKRRFASHEHARDRLATPFKPTDPEMKKVEL